MEAPPRTTAAESRPSISGRVSSVQVTGLERIRRRVPLVVFLLLLVMVLLMVGFACACFSDQPLKAAERTLGTGLATPALVEMWAAMVVLLTALPLFTVRRTAPNGRASPALLQTFLR